MSSPAVSHTGKNACATGIGCILFLFGCGGGHPVPALPSIDASLFQKEMADAKASPSDPDRTLRLCMVLHAHEQYQNAGQCYARAYALDPRRFDTLYCWGHALAAEGTYAT